MENCSIPFVLFVAELFGLSISSNFVYHLNASHARTKTKKKRKTFHQQSLIFMIRIHWIGKQARVRQWHQCARWNWFWFHHRNGSKCSHGILISNDESMIVGCMLRFVTVQFNGPAQWYDCIVYSAKTSMATCWMCLQNRTKKRRRKENTPRHVHDFNQFASFMYSRSIDYWLWPCNS